MEKIFGCEERIDSVQKIGRRSWAIYYGLGMEGDMPYNYRLILDHEPTSEEVREILLAHINETVGEKIVNGFTWQGMPVYLSRENQQNFKAAYDYNVQTAGSMLPIRFKLGETSEGAPVYYTFESLEEFGDFYSAALNHINTCLSEGWAEKDSLDISAFCD